MIEEVVVVLHQTCWQQQVGSMVEDVVQFPSLELSEMWRQRLNELQTMLVKLLNLLSTNSCNDSCVQDVLEYVGWLTHICIFPSKLQSIIDAPLPNLCQCVLLFQYDGVSQDYAVGLVCLEKVQIKERLCQFFVLLPLGNKLMWHKHSIFWNPW